MVGRAGLALVLGLVGCGPQPANTSTAPSELPRATLPGPDCWREYWPVRTCESPRHPERVGLWARREGPGDRFASAFVYDGCHVAILYAWRSVVDLDHCAVTYGVDGGFGLRLANRTEAVWDGGDLWSESSLGSFFVARWTGEGFAWHGSMVVVRRGTSLAHELVERPTSEDLVRLTDASDLDSNGRDLLCVRWVVRPRSECGENPPGEPGDNDE